MRVSKWWAKYPFKRLFVFAGLTVRMRWSTPKTLSPQLFWERTWSRGKWAVVVCTVGTVRCEQVAVDHLFCYVYSGLACLSSRDFVGTFLKCYRRVINQRWAVFTFSCKNLSQKLKSVHHYYKVNPDGLVWFDIMPSWCFLLSLKTYYLTT